MSLKKLGNAQRIYVSLTLEDREKYVAIIDEIWESSMMANTAESISDEAAEAVETVLENIIKCTENIGAIFDIFEDIYIGASSLRVLIKKTPKDILWNGLGILNRGQIIICV